MFSKQNVRIFWQSEGQATTQRGIKKGTSRERCPLPPGQVHETRMAGIQGGVPRSMELNTKRKGIAWIGKTEHEDEITRF